MSNFFKSYIELVIFGDNLNIDEINNKLGVVATEYKLKKSNPKRKICSDIWGWKTPLVSTLDINEQHLSKLYKNFNGKGHIFKELISNNNAVIKIYLVIELDSTKQVAPSFYLENSDLQKILDMGASFELCIYN